MCKSHTVKLFRHKFSSECFTVRILGSGIADRTRRGVIRVIQYLRAQEYPLVQLSKDVFALHGLKRASGAERTVAISGGAEVVTDVYDAPGHNSGVLGVPHDIEVGMKESNALIRLNIKIVLGTINIGNIHTLISESFCAWKVTK